MQVTGQNAVTYGYDDAHRITGITQGTNVVGFTYDAASRRTQATLPNGVTIDYADESGVGCFGAGACEAAFGGRTHATT
jgi:YD repeat-containing protein